MNACPHVIVLNHDCDLHGISNLCNVNGSNIVTIKYEWLGAMKTPVYLTLNGSLEVPRDKMVGFGPNCSAAYGLYLMPIMHCCLLSGNNNM